MITLPRPVKLKFLYLQSPRPLTPSNNSLTPRPSGNIFPRTSDARAGALTGGL